MDKVNGKLTVFFEEPFWAVSYTHLDVYKRQIPQSHKTFYAGLCGGIEIRAHHAAVFPVVHLPVYNGIGIVLHIRIGRNGGVNGFAFAQLRQLCLLISAMNILHRIMQLVGKLQSLDRVHGVVHTMSSAYRLLSAQHLSLIHI